MLTSDDIRAIRGQARAIPVKRAARTTVNAVTEFLISLPYLLGLIAGGIWRAIVITALALRKGWWDGTGAVTKTKEPPPSQ